MDSTSWQLNDDCIDVSITPSGENWEQWVLLRGDAHWDNPCNNEALEKTHLKQAMDRNALIFDVGDMVCGMQGKGDPRANLYDLKAEHKGGNYLDLLVATTAARYEPYKENWVMIAQGNHESGILKRKETDITQRVVDIINYTGGNVINGQFFGAIRFVFKKYNTTTMFYSHTPGVGGKATKGANSVPYRAGYYPDADIIWSGDIHDTWHITHGRVKLLPSGKMKLCRQDHIVTSTYKDEFTTKRSGFHHEKSRGPKPLGAYWLRFFRKDGRVDYDIIQAK